jgi:glycosyltransferase involved in cell wall biosynthesis
MRVLFVVPYPPNSAPGQRFRFEQWLRLLPAGSISADIRPLLSSAAYRHLYRPGGTARKAAGVLTGLGRRLRDLTPLGRYDAAFLYREAFPLGPPVMEVLLERRVPTVYDFDDAIFLGDTSEANRSVARWKSPEKVAGIVARAAATTVGNDWLAAYARQFSDEVVVLPTTIDVDAYRPRPRRPRELVRLGWSGSPTTAKHLHTIDGALRRLLKELPVELVVVGDASYRLSVAGGSSARVSAKAWSAATEIDDVASFDIGLMPLPDDDWSRGKCGFKALLYLALGVPTVASPVGVNPAIIRSPDVGLLAGTEDEWVEAVGRVVEDEALRRRLAVAGRHAVVERYSGQRWAPRFLEVLERSASREATSSPVAGA